MLPSRTATGPRAGKAAGEGAPSQKTCRSPSTQNPSRKEDFVRKTFITLAALIALAVLLVPSALGATVSVRVEGRTLSIFGSLETRFEAGANPMQALDLASLRGEFYYHVTTTSFGPYVDQIGRHSAGGTNGWVFKVNGALPPVGADQVQLNDGDRVLWYWATFGPTGGWAARPPTPTRPQRHRGNSQEEPGTEPGAAGR